MRPIRRAAVSGLFALWLAPLSAGAASQSAGESNYANGRTTRVESLVVEARHSRSGWARQDGEESES